MDAIVIAAIITGVSSIIGAILGARIRPGPVLSRGSRGGVIGGVIGALLGLGGYFLVTLLFLSPCAPFAPTSVAITSPVEGGDVSQSTIVQGTACHIPPDKKLWLFVVPGGATGYYPQPGGPIQISSEGKWSETAFLGQTGSIDTGKEFVVYTALVDGAGEVAIRQYFEVARRSGKYIPFYPLPSGIQTISQIRVIRI